MHSCVRCPVRLVLPLLVLLLLHSCALSAAAVSTSAVNTQHIPAPVAVRWNTNLTSPMPLELELKDKEEHDPSIEDQRYLEAETPQPSQEVFESPNPLPTTAGQTLPRPEPRYLFTKTVGNKRALTFWGLMVAGAVSRSVAQTAMHPANVIKTMLQTPNGKIPALSFHVLTRGAGAQFIMSVPHGAINFAVLEGTKSALFQFFPNAYLGPALDFLSSVLSTFFCSIVSTPQMVITDRIMAGIYPDFLSAVHIIASTEGVRGFYAGWFPALVQKIPSYGLTWVFYQQLKRIHRRVFDRDGTNVENTAMGCLAAAGTVCVMIPVDTIKTRIVTQPKGDAKLYTGMIDCLFKVIQLEGVGALYKALPPRLASVVPMMGIQFGVYEFMKKLLLKNRASADALHAASCAVNQPPEQSCSEDSFDSFAEPEVSVNHSVSSAERLPLRYPKYHPNQDEAQCPESQPQIQQQASLDKQGCLERCQAAESEQATLNAEIRTVELQDVDEHKHKIE